MNITPVGGLKGGWDIFKGILEVKLSGLKSVAHIFGPSESLDGTGKIRGMKEGVR